MARTFSAGSSTNANVSATPVTGVPLTLACWMNPSTTTSGTLMAVQTTTARSRFTLTYPDVNNGNKTTAASVDYAGLITAAVSTTTATTGVWTHIAGVFTTNSNRTVYVNAVGTNNTTTATAPAGLNSIMLGARRDSILGLYYSGRIAQAGLWNIALTAADIAALSSGYTPLQVRPDALVGYWPLGGLYPNLSPERCLVNSTYNLTLVGSPSVSADPPGIIFETYQHGLQSDTSFKQTWIKVGGVWKKGTINIKQGGVWKVGDPKIKISGSWR